MIPQLDGIVTKVQDIIALFQLTEGESLPDFNMRSLQASIKVYKI